MTYVNHSPVGLPSLDPGGVKRAEFFREALQDAVGRPLGKGFADKHRRPQADRWNDHQWRGNRYHFFRSPAPYPTTISASKPSARTTKSSLRAANLLVCGAGSRDHESKAATHGFDARGR